MGHRVFVSCSVGGIVALYRLLQETPHLAADVWALGRICFDNITSTVMVRVFWELCERAYIPETTSVQGGQSRAQSLNLAALRDVDDATVISGY